MPAKTQAADKADESKDRNQPQMLEALRRVLLATIGAAAIAQDEVESLVTRLVERGEIAEKDGKKLVQEIMDKRKNRVGKVEDEFTRHLESMLERLNVPTRSDVEALSEKIAALSKQIDELKKS